MKVIIILGILLISSLLIIDAWGIGAFIFILIIIIILFGLLVSKGKKTKEDQDLLSSVSNKKIDYYTEALSSINEKHKEEKLTLPKTKRRGTKPGFKFEDLEGHERLSGDILEQDISEADPTGYFFDKKVVFTGKLLSYSREELANILKKRGADINTSISKKTNIVIIGDNPGPSKIEMISDLKHLGYDIRLILEDEIEGYL